MHTKQLKTFILGLFLLAPALSHAMVTEEPIILNVGLINPTTPAIGGGAKVPIRIPSVSIDGNTLTFYAPCFGFTLRIVDCDGVVVYNQVIPYETIQVMLPDSLQGEYELQLVSGNKMFYGTIELKSNLVK